MSDCSANYVLLEALRQLSVISGIRNYLKVTFDLGEVGFFSFPLVLFPIFICLQPTDDQGGFSLSLEKVLLSPRWGSNPQPSDDRVRCLNH